MKTIKIALIPLTLLCLIGCSETDSSSSFESSSSQTAQIEVSDIWDDKYAGTSFDDSTKIESCKYWKDGEYTNIKDESFVKTSDYKYEFYRQNVMRYVDVSGGYALTLNKEVTIDREMAKNGTHFTTQNTDLRISAETPAPYTLDYKGYTTYMDEWLMPYLRKPAYYSENNFTQFADPYEESLAINSEYSISAYFVTINNPGSIELPHYHIAVVRPRKAYAKYLVLVYKTKRADKSGFEEILASISMFTAKGATKNYRGQQEKKENPNWSEETKAFYNRFCNLTKPDWGFFVDSMNNAASDDEDEYRTKITAATEDLEEAFDYTFEIMPNYSHLKWGNIEYSFASLCYDLAGGNGFNGKKVLQYTYQFTVNNNGIGFDKESDIPTSMIDVLRGTYDSILTKLARDIKAYSKPVLFRLNNEMNTDWTTYCGLFNFLDPQLFIDSWIYLYNIFEAEGVDNCIWIWNPFDTNGPRNNWSQEMSYFPGNDYVQAIGVTSYEFNNGGEEGVTVLSFRSRFTDIYDSYSPVFGNYPWIAAEFGCAAGGEVSGVLGRNERFQASWVESMFSDICKSKKYCSNIKGYVWFDCNDYTGTKIRNYLRIEKTLTQTREAFKNGFTQLKTMA